VRRAYELWRELENRAGERLLFVTGGLDIGPPDGKFVPGSLRSCKQHHLPHEVLTPPEVTRRFPGFRLPENLIHTRIA
jgi:sarcosine oxidase